MPLTIFGKNKQANSITYDKASIHTGAPGDSGAANEVRALTAQEVADGETAYQRKVISFDAAVAGARDSNVQPTFNIPSGETISHYALWEGLNCVATGELAQAETYGGHGTYKLTDVDINNT